ncbi:PIG-L family deacetylase [Pedobacter sp. UBA4863]|uniref:PIG-L deacetylase family protein n=1 Tax=Pedobacter sp. UBA4863 TaxID=1947060 RepID=UPI0025E47613|nr:PIG-L family deacetylase [Pedobacter sp. UBA4863]
MLQSLKNKKILIVVAHPDDEILGLGGTMSRLIRNFGITAKVIILGEGITSRSDNRDLDLWDTHLKEHRNNIYQAQKKIGYHEVSIHNFPDNRFDSVPLLEIIKVIEKEKEEFLPEVIFTHHGGDVNIDHQRTFEAVVTCCRPMQDEVVKTIITFETMSGTEWRASTDPKHFIPNVFISIDEQSLNDKIAAMECYEFEKREYPHPRSPEALKIVAQRWGIVVGVEYAEAFCLVRNIC